MKKLSNRIRTGVLASLVVTSIVTIALVLRSERKILWEDLNHNCLLYTSPSPRD